LRLRSSIRCADGIYPRRRHCASRCAACAPCAAQPGRGGHRSRKPAVGHRARDGHRSVARLLAQHQRTGRRARRHRRNRRRRTVRVKGRRRGPRRSARRRTQVGDRRRLRPHRGRPRCVRSRHRMASRRRGAGRVMGRARRQGTGPRQPRHGLGTHRAARSSLRRRACMDYIGVALAFIEPDSACAVFATADCPNQRGLQIPPPQPG
jgi:hypothetical protein